LKYLGLESIYSEAEGGGNLRAIYPEGHVAIINAKGELAAYVGGKDSGMRINSVRSFDNPEAALAWVLEVG
jgi:hypothetical protein